ncbi:hypothetical protein D3C76_1879830 [compost metagenome]
MLRLGFLYNPHHSVQHHNQENNDGIRQLADHPRDYPGGDQDIHQHIIDLGKNPA